MISEDIEQKHINNTKMPADNELTAILNRRNEINDAIDSGEDIKPRFVKTSVYTDFSEFSRKQIKDYERIFQM